MGISFFTHSLKTIHIKRDTNYLRVNNNTTHSHLCQWHIGCRATRALRVLSSYIMPKPHTALGTVLIRTKRLCVCSRGREGGREGGRKEGREGGREGGGPDPSEWVDLKLLTERRRRREERRGGGGAGHGRRSDLKLGVQPETSLQLDHHQHPHHHQHHLSLMTRPHLSHR